SEQGPTVVITVSDNGPGIPPEVTDRIFSPFFTTKPQGSGLGLAIVRKIVDAHDGRIDVGGRSGGGTVFRVTLPFRSQQQLFSERGMMGGILVADDHASLRRGIVRALSDARHEVDEAPNGNVAIEKLHEG